MTDHHPTLAWPGPGGTLLSFENPPGLYPVNRYQSLLLAGHAHVQALDLAARQGRPLGDLRAWEACAGGAAAATVMKVAGVGHVRISDVHRAGLEHGVANARRNGVVFDEIEMIDLVGTEDVGVFDLVVANPPCGRDLQVRAEDVGAVQRAVRGGAGGVALALRLLEDVPRVLAPGGRFCMVLTSTMDLPAVVDRLEGRFPGAWHVADNCPAAQPFSPLAQSERGRAFSDRMLDLRAAGRVFVWRGDDARLWRLTWTIVVTPDRPRRATVPMRLFPHAFGLELCRGDFATGLAEVRATVVGRDWMSMED